MPQPRITVVYTLDNGQHVHASIGDFGWFPWGAGHDVLSLTMPMTEALHLAALGQLDTGEDNSQ